LQQRRGVLNILNTNAGGVARQPGLLRSRLPANNLKRKILQSRAAAALSTKKRQIEDSGDEESVTEESMEESDLDLESDEDDGGGESSEDFSE
jgi:Tfp pilus assembly protein PilX